MCIRFPLNKNDRTLRADEFSDWRSTIKPVPLSSAVRAVCGTRAFRLSISRISYCLRSAGNEKTKPSFVRTDVPSNASRRPNLLPRAPLPDDDALLCTRFRRQANGSVYFPVSLKTISPDSKYTHMCTAVFNPFSPPTFSIRGVFNARTWCSFFSLFFVRRTQRLQDKPIIRRIVVRTCVCARARTCAVVVYRVFNPVGASWGVPTEGGREFGNYLKTGNQSYCIT